MEHLDHTDLLDPTPAAQSLSTADYVALLHPITAIGKPTIMVIDDNGKAHSKTCRIGDAPWVAECCADASAYISLHRFHGPRRDARLAEINALYLDLDVDLAPMEFSADWAKWSMKFALDIEGRGIPAPSFLNHTGRGLAAIWMLDPMPPQAKRRWKAAQKALIGLYRRYGADPKCCDTARVFRLPGSINPKSGRLVQIIDGTLRRYPFDALADRIYVACGRPTRADLKQRAARLPGQRQKRPHRSGISPRMRFAAIQKDLERLLDAWGGRAPEGHRNTWLHLWATCLTHLHEPGDIHGRVQDMAEVATPGLSTSEVLAISKHAAEKAELPRSAKPTMDGRYHYSGATMADLLGVSDEDARDLALAQIFSPAERRRRKAVKERSRRAASGAVPREEYLAANAVSRSQPWKAAGISRATWYRRRRAEGSASGSEEKSDETSPCPLQGGYAMPEAQAGRRSLSALYPLTPKSASARQSRRSPAHATGRCSGAGMTRKAPPSGLVWAAEIMAQPRERRPGESTP